MGLQKIQPPALPVPPNEYDPQYLMQLIRIISIYFRQIASQAPIITNTANWSAVPTTTDIGFSDLPFNDMYRGATEDILRIKVDGLSYVPIPTQAEINQAEADAIAASNAFTTAGLALKVNKAGDTMTGSLNVPTVNATNVVSTTQGGIRAPGMVLQVQQAIKTDQFAYVGTGPTNIFAEVPGLIVSITPTSVNSKVLVMVDVHLGMSVYQARGRIYRNGAPLAGAIAPNVSLRSGVTFASNFYGITAAGANESIYHIARNGMVYLDSPATTAPTTYSIGVSAYEFNTVYVNRSQQFSDTLEYDPPTISTITVMEVAG